MYLALVHQRCTVLGGTVTVLRVSGCAAKEDRHPLRSLPQDALRALAHVEDILRPR